MKKILSAAMLAILILAAGYYVYFKKTNGPEEEKTQNLSEIKIAYSTESLQGASIVIAFEKKYFEKYDLSPKMIPLKGGREVVQAMISGQAEFGTATIVNFVPAMAKDAPIRIIAGPVSSPAYVLVRPNENIKSFTDLYGKTIAVPPKGANELALKVVLSEENVDVSKIKLLNIEKTYNMSALFGTKEADAVVVSEQDVEQLMKKGAIILPAWEEKGYLKNMPPRNFIAANEDFINQHEDIVRRFLEACIDAERLIKNNPQEAAEILAEHTKKESGGAVNYEAADILEKWQNKTIVNALWQDPSVAMRFVEKAKEVGIIDKELTQSQAFDTRFRDMLEAAQNEIYGE